MKYLTHFFTLHLMNNGNDGHSLAKLNNEIEHDLSSHGLDWTCTAGQRGSWYDETAHLMCTDKQAAYTVYYTTLTGSQLLTIKSVIEAELIIGGQSAVFIETDSGALVLDHSDLNMPEHDLRAALAGNQSRSITHHTGIMANNSHPQTSYTNLA